ncbi:MAG TPA: hypothetical protein VGR58_07100 [Candidatus Acidoferrum sp.]|nr:hypothetical protein [Candidatus Acidoferrum sp.]
MSPRSAFLQLITKAAIGFAALFLVGVVLAAIPNHRAPAMVQAPVSLIDLSEQAQDVGQAMDHSKMAGMSMDMGDEKSAEAAATHDMAHMHHGDNPHMHMTSPRPQTAVDVQRANEIVKELRAGIEKYKDYHVALSEGYKIFLPNVPQPEYHFTNYGHGFLEAFTFDPARPTSLLYKKTADGYELVGAMYTMPKRASEEQLNERVPLSVATWHLHTNLCMPPRDERKTADYTKFGLHGSITTQEACDAAGGKFRPVVFGWMVHVYPYENSADKIFAMHHRD